MFELEDLFDLTVKGAFANKEEFLEFAKDANPDDLFSLIAPGAFKDSAELSSLLKKKDDPVVPTSQEADTESTTQGETGPGSLVSSQVGSEEQISGIKAYFDSRDLDYKDVDDDVNIQAAINSGIISEEDLIVAGYRQPTQVDVLSVPDKRQVQAAKDKISALRVKTQEEIDYTISQRRLDTDYAFEQSASEDTFVDDLYDSSMLALMNVNPKDFDGFLEEKGHKRDFLDKQDRGLFDRSYGQVTDTSISLEAEKLRLLNLYVSEQVDRDLKRQKLNDQKETGVNPDFVVGKRFNVSDSNVNLNMLPQYYEEKFPEITKKLKQRDAENRETYQRHIDGDMGVGNFISNVAKEGWRGFSDRVTELSSSASDIIGLDNMADAGRLALSTEKMLREDNLTYGYTSGKTTDYNGRKYLVDQNNQVYDLDSKIRVTQFLGQKAYEEIIDKAKTFGYKDNSFSGTGTAYQTANVVGDLVVQLSLTRGVGTTMSAAGGLTKGLGALGKTKDFLRSVPISRSMSSAIIAQATMGASSGFERTLSLAKEQGLNEGQARELASYASSQMAVLYALTAPISPQTKATEALFGKIRGAAIKDAVEAYKNMGIQGVRGVFQKYGQTALNLTGEGIKETVQENVQQAGEAFVVNKNINEEAGREIARDTITMDEFINTSIISFIAGGLLPGAGSVSSSINRRTRKILGFDGVDRMKALDLLSRNEQKVVDLLNDQVAKGVYTMDAATDLLSEINTYKEGIGKIPTDLKPDTALEVMGDIEKIRALEAKRDKLDPIFHEGVNQEIDQVREAIKEKIGKDAVQEQEAGVVPDAEPAEGVQEVEAEVRVSPEEKAETVGELLDRPVTLTKLGGSTLDAPVEGMMYLDGQQVVVEDADGNITEIGNVNEVSGQTLEQMGIEQQMPEVKTTEDGNIEFQGEVYDPNNVKIKKDKKGNISSVIIRTPDGSKTKTLRGRNAEDAAYNILLKKAQESKDIEQKLEQDEEFQNELRKAEAAPQTEADQDTRPPATERTKLQSLIDNAKKAISKLGLNVEIVFPKTEQEYKKLTNEQDRSRDQVSGGKYVGGKIYINPAAANARTVAHEVFHALLLSRGMSDAQARAITERMLNSVKKVADGDLLERLEQFSQQYDEALQSEESIAELFGILAEGYPELPKPTQNIIKRWLDKLAKILGLKQFTDAEVIDLLNTVSGKVARGEQISESDIEMFGDVEKRPAKAERKQKTEKDVKAKKQRPGNRLFNEPLKGVKKIADGYYKRVFKSERPLFEGTRELDTERSKRISDAFEAMEYKPNDPEVKAAYEALSKETLEQYQAFLDAGYTVEIDNVDAYGNSQEMIDDLRQNKRIKIFSTEAGFGKDPITDKQRQENPLLRDSGFKDVNGESMLVNDVFRAIHDFFGHAELGNSFGAKGEENAWNVHSRMFSPLARKAMTTETRGQNSYVNFSGVNQKVEALRDKARTLRDQGKEAEAQKIVDEIYALTAFADQKIGLLPEEFSSIKPIQGEALDDSNVIDTEQGEGGSVGTINVSREQKRPAPKVKDDPRDFASLVQEKPISDFNGKSFVTNMYDFTTAGEVDLGNGFKIVLFGGKNYPALMMQKQGLNIGDVSNIAAFNTKAQAEAFIRNAQKGNASLFMPHAGGVDTSWQFQHSIFEALTNLVIDENILTNEELISSFNEAINSKAGQEAFNKFKAKYGKDITNLDGFLENPKELVELLNTENNFSPDLRKILNGKIATNKKLQQAVGVKNKSDFALKMEDPMNVGVETGDLMGVVEFDNTTFEISKPKKTDPDYHPSFAWTIKAKVLGLYQPTNFYKSYDVTNEYVKYNKDETIVSKKKEGKEFVKSNVKSSAGSIPKVAKVAPREQKQMKDRPKTKVDKLREDSEKELNKKRKKKESLALRLRKKWLDRQAFVKRALKGLSGKGALKAARMMVVRAGAKGYAKVRYKKAEKEIFGGLNKDEMNFFESLIYARRIIAINENRAARGMEPYFGKDKYSEEDARKNLEELKESIPEKQFNKINARADKYFGVFEENLKRLYESGRISKTTYDQLKDVEYTPIRTLKYLKLSENELDVELGMSAADIKALSNENENDILFDAKWNLMTTINAVEAKAFENKMLKAFNQAFEGATKAEKEGMAEYMIDNPVIGKNKNGENLRKFKKAEPGFVKVFFYEDGVKDYMIIREDMANELLDIKTRDKSFEAIGKYSGAQILRFFATGGNPLFIVGNTAVDFANILLLSDVYSGFKPLGAVQLSWDFTKNFLKAISNGGNYDKIYTEFMEYGAGMDYLSQEGLQALRTPWNKNSNTARKALLSIGEAMSYMGQASEIAFRIAVYEKTKSNLIKKYKKENGKSPIGEDLDDIKYEAARESRETIDFSQGGTSSKKLDVVMPYLNAGFQGYRKVVDYANKNPKGFASSMLQYAGMSAALIAFSLSNLITKLKDDDDEEELNNILNSISSYEKSAYHIIFTGNKDKNGEYEYIRIKKLPGVGFVSTLAEQMILNLHDKKYKVDSETITNSFKQGLPFDPEGVLSRNPVISGAFAYIGNYDTFRKQDIFKGPSNKVIKPEAEGLYDDRVAGLYKELAPMFGMSPVRTQALFEKFITSESTNPFISLLYASTEGLYEEDTLFGKETQADKANILKNIEKKWKRSTNSKLLDYKADEEMERIEAKLETDVYVKERKVYKSIKNKTDNGEEISISDIVTLVKENFDIVDQKKYIKKYYLHVRFPEIDRKVLDLIYEDNAEVQANRLYQLYGPSFESEEMKQLGSAMAKAGRKRLSKKTMYYYNKLRNK